ncbi:MAG: uroporphyrinogen decarboxylase family protein [Candidatus Bathyarchaeia archaeon]
MDVRERFLATMCFKDVDRPPLCEFLGYWPETVQRWYGEGLPIGMSVPEYLGFDGCLTPSPWTSVSKISFSTSGLTDWGGTVPIDFGPIPRFGPVVISEDERYRLVIDEVGVKKMFIKGRMSGMPQFLEHPVKNLGDFDKVKARFNPKDKRRYPLDWSEDIFNFYNKRGLPLGIKFPGFFGFARNMMGLTGLLIAFFRDPDLVREMMVFWGDFLCQTMEEALANLRIDYASSWEDMSYNRGSHISPKLFREFIQPEYRMVAETLRNNGVRIFMVDTDGNCEDLIPPLLEAGVNCIYPLEVQAGMNAVELRRKYGRSLVMIGNINKKVLIEGPEAIRREVESKVPVLIKDGGYIPSVDHEVPKDVPFRNYIYYINLLKSIYGLD